MEFRVLTMSGLWGLELRVGFRLSALTCENSGLRVGNWLLGFRLKTLKGLWLV